MARKRKKGKARSINHSQPQEVLKKGSKDDLDFRYQTPPPSPPQPEQAPPTIAGRVYSYVEPVVKIGTQASESKYGKILLSNAVSRATTLLFSVGLLAEVWTPAVPFAVTGAVASIAAVGASSVLDIVKTRSLRKLAEESDLLVKNRTALSKQQYILQNINPELSHILQDHLYTPYPQQRDNNYSLGTEKVLNAGQVVFDNVPSAAEFAVRTMVAASDGSPMSIVHAIRTGATSANSLISGSTSAKNMVDVTKALKLHISEERQYTGEYNNIEGLRKNVEMQEIQTIAIQELVQDRDFQRSKLTPEQTQEKFEQLIEKVQQYYILTPEEQREQFPELAQKYQVQKSYVAKESDSILSDVGRVLNPSYVQPTLKPDSELTKAMVSEKTKESAKSIITPEVRLALAPNKSKHAVSQASFDKFGSVSAEDLSKRKKEASYLDPAETHYNKAKTQPKKSQTVKIDIAR
jgi:hypothetical protein